MLILLYCVACWWFAGDVFGDALVQLEVKSQKEELQRQRDALQRQIDLFAEQRRMHGYAPAIDLRSSPHHVTRVPAPPHSDRMAETGRVRTKDARSHPVARQLSPVGSPVLARVGSAGNMAAMDSRAAAAAMMTRVNSAGNLTTSRLLRGDTTTATKPLPVHLMMSATNEMRWIAGGAPVGSNAQLRSTTSLPGTTSPVQQIIPVKLSRPSSTGSNPPRAPNDHRVARNHRDAADLEKTGSGTEDKSASGFVGSPRSASTTLVNILPMKLAEGHRDTSSSSTSPPLQCVSQRAGAPATATAADDDDDDGDDGGKLVERTDNWSDRLDSKIHYF